MNSAIVLEVLECLILLFLSVLYFIHLKNIIMAFNEKVRKILIRLLKIFRKEQINNPINCLVRDLPRLCSSVSTTTTKKIEIRLHYFHGVIMESTD